MLMLVLLVVTALGFDFTNGFHDTGNAMATSIATGALKPKVAVMLAASLNLVGAFLGTKVAKTVGSGIIDAPAGKGAVATVAQGSKVLVIGVQPGGSDPRQAALLVKLVVDSAKQLAEDSSLDVKELDEPTAGDNVIDFRRYLEVQRRLFEEAS